jgi:hypothetical protein
MTANPPASSFRHRHIRRRSGHSRHRPGRPGTAQAAPTCRFQRRRSQMDGGISSAKSQGRRPFVRGPVRGRTWTWVQRNGGDVEKTHQGNIKERFPSRPVARNLKAIDLSSRLPNGSGNDKELSDLQWLPFNTINRHSAAIVLRNCSEAEGFPG